ncbi:FAS1 domain-containing protein [Hymenopellis radicata]|nr:FAS1 domain-containing protein [Hymenopellis radicata]
MTIPDLPLATVVSGIPSLSYFHKVLTPEITQILNATPSLTLFLPVNDAWMALDPLERTYLESSFAADDLGRILNMHAVVQKGVTWSDSFDPAVNLTTIDGQTLEIIVSPKKTMISTADLVEPDIYASNGVLHLVSSLLIPPGALQLTPEKYLLTLNCTSFVSLIHASNLTSLINDTETKYTILAPSDEVLTVFGDGDLPPPGSDELKKLLQYHFIPGRWRPEKLATGMLLETALEEEGLEGGRQVLGIELSDGKKVRFGGAGVIGEPIEVNNTLIYFISRPLVPPTDALQTALPFLDLSSFLAAVFSTSLAETLKTTSRTSLLIPHNSAFKRLGLLVSAHLLAASSKSDLEKVLLHHTLDSVQYADALHNSSQHTFSSLEGSDLNLEKAKNGTLFLSASGGWAGMKTALYTKDILTQTGVIHEVSDILIPRTVDLTIGKLVKAAKGSTMATLVSKAGLDWVLNGTAPPEDSRWAQEGFAGTGWTLLCPTDDAFKEFNLTALYENVEWLQEMVGQHLIATPHTSGSSFMVPDENVLNNNRPLQLDDSPTYSTLRTQDSEYGDIIFRLHDDGSGKYIVGIKGARGTDGNGDWAQVEAWGRSTTGGGTGGVIQIDAVLMPYHPPWWIEYGAPTVVGIVGSLLIIGFFLGVRWVWRRDVTEATYEPVGGYGRDDGEDS